MEQNIKKKNRVWIWVVIIVIGLVLIGAGAICFNVFGMKSYNTADINYEFECNFSDLEIENGVCNFNIVKSDDDKVYIKGTNVPEGRYTAKVQGGTLKIEYKERKWLNLISFGSWNNENMGEITLYLPEKDFMSLEFDGGVGVNKISDVTVRKLDYDGGVGENYFNNVKVLEDAELDFGVGETQMESCVIQRGDIDVGVGELYFSGNILGDTSVDTGVGEVKMDIDGYRNDYEINYDQGIGEVNINSSTESVTSSTMAATRIRLDLDCGIGDVTVNFK